jgi:hypothetical protein
MIVDAPEEGMRRLDDEIRAYRLRLAGHVGGC